VVGGGDSACEEAIHLSHTASTVYLIHRRDKLRASKIMVDRLFKVKNIVPIWNSSITEITGNGYVEKIVLDRHEELNVKGLFVAIGHTPNTGFVKNLVKLDDAGYIVTNDRMETSLKGVYAAGDVRDPIYRQAITAAGSGCMASLEIERSLGE
jgi:thioredoxin reductase (NADPH)